MAKAFTIVQNTSGVDVQFGSPTDENLFGTPNTDVFFGFGGNDVLRGADNDDFLVGENGADSLRGENGDDFLLYSFEGDSDIFSYGVTNFVGPSQIQDVNDRQFLIDEWYDIFNLEADLAAAPQSDIEVNGGLGTDTAILDLSYRTTAITFTLGTPNTTISGENITLDSIEQVWLRGSTLDDSITGGALNDRLYGNNGADTLNGGAGDDFVFGGNGYDTLFGGDGNDFLVSTNRFQQFDRANGFGVQVSSNSPVNDYFFGLQTIYEQTGNDEDRLIDGGAGDQDVAVIDFEFVLGGSVNFTLAPTTLTTIATTLGTQIINVEAIWAIDSAGNDTITGGALSDRFLSIGGTDTFDGRDGSDWIELSSISGTATNINLANNAFNTGLAAGDTYISIENIVGNSGVNVFTGDDKANTLYGRAGNDTLNGGNGDDLLNGGTGGDTLNGGLGTDTVSYDTAVTNPFTTLKGVTVDLLNAASANTGEAAGDSYIEIENIIGSRRGDDLRGDNSDNVIDGGLGNDTVAGRDGNDTFLASNGSDNFDGGNGVDTLILTGLRTDYTITATPTGFKLIDTRGANFDGMDLVTGVENFRFGNGDTRTAANLINSAPALPTLSQPTPLAENAAQGTVVATLSATDADGGAITYQLNPAGSALFEVFGNPLVLRSGANIDFEAGATRTFEVTATDSAGASSGPATLSIQIANVNEAPSAPSFAGGAIDENAAGGTVIGTLTASDPDGTAPGFSIVGGSSLFAIDGNKLVVAPGADLDFEAGATRSLKIVSTDGIATSAPIDVTVTLKNVVEPIRGTSGDDAGIAGTPGDDIVEALGGDDVILGSTGADSLRGGAGLDTVRYTKAVTLDLLDSTENSGQADGDTFSSIERFQFSSGRDDVFGNNLKNQFFGGNGADTIEGRGGNDVLSGELGNDTIDGGDGRDIITGGKGRDILAGGDGTDFFVFEALSDRGDTIDDYASAQKDKLKFSRDGFGLDDTFKLVLGDTLLIDKTPGDDEPAFLFNSKTGVLSFDRNGDDAGGSYAIVTLVDVESLKVSDFQLFA